MPTKFTPEGVPYFVEPYFRDGLGGPKPKRKPPIPYAPPTDAQLAAFIAWMLVIAPQTIVGACPIVGPDAEAKLVVFIRAKLDELSDLADRTPQPDRTDRANWLIDLNSRKTLRYCRAVMGRHLPPMRNTGGGFVPRGNERQYIRGVFFPLEPLTRKKVEQ